MCYHKDSERVRKAHMYDIDVDILNICTMEYKLQIKENDWSMSKKMIRSFAAFALVLCMLLTNLGGWNLALAEETQVEKSKEVKETKETNKEPKVNEEEHKENPQDENKDENKDENEEVNEEAKDPSEEAQEEDKVKPLEQNTEAKDNLGLDIGGEIVPQEVGAGIDVKAPTIDPVFYNATTISGGDLAKARVEVGNKKQTVIATVHVTLKGEDGTVKATLEVTPKRGTKWKVDLPEEKKVAKGDTVTVYQQIGEDKSPEVTANAQASKASSVTLTMPEGEIWIEQTSSNLVNEDEQAEAVEMFNNANTAIAGDIESVKFSIDGTSHAYYEVTYTDGSTSGQVEATNLQIKQVTETSRGAKLNDITIVDNVIKGKLEGNGPFDNIKVQIVLKLSEASKGTFCNENKCIVDKDSSKAVDATVDTTTGEFSYTIKSTDKIELGNVAGVSVKEPHKFKSCSQTTVIAPIPEKTEVKDPRKLTGKDKESIDAAIRKAYIVNGESKLPNGTGFNEGAPAVIQIDDSGNVKIFSGNDVVVNEWDDDGKAIPKKNEDGSYKLKDDAVPTATYPAKDLLKNKKPEKAEININESDKTKITINAKAVDTDANVITVSYTGSDDSSKTLKATKANDGTWSITEGEGSVDANGVVTLEISKVKGGTDVTATVSDKGGIADDDKEALTSDQAKFKITKAILVEALGGLDPVDIKKWVGEDPEWKKGVKAKKSENATDVNKLLNEEKTSFTDENSRGTTAEGDSTGKIKVTFDDNSFIEVENQMLYVSNHVTSMERKDKVPTDALDVQFKLGEGVVVEDKDPNSGEVTKTTKGDKDNPVLYKEYKVKPGTNFSTYEHPTLKKTIFDLIDEKADKGYVDPVWKGQDANNPSNFTASDTNKVFTATATKTYKVTLDANTGSGTMEGATVKKGETYKLPANTFTAPENKKFAGWLVGDATTTTEPGKEITITADTVIKAKWESNKPVTPPSPNPNPNPNPNPYYPDPDDRPHRPHHPSTPDKDKDNDNNKDKDKNDSKKDPNEPSITDNPDGTTTVTPGKNDDPVNIKGKDKDGKPIDVVVEKDKNGKWHVDKDAPVSVDPKTGKITIAKGVKDITAKSIIRLERGTHYRYIYGYPDGTVRPEGLITRAEAAALIARIAMLDMSDKAKPNFKDTPSMWYNSAINVVVKKNLMLADDGKFRPNEAITRAEFARALFYIDAKNAAVAPFADVKGHKFEEAINQAYGNGRIAGYPDGTFRPDAFIKRAEAAKILNHYAKRGVDHDGMKGVEIYTTHFTDLNERYWGYYEIMEAANTHEYERRVNTILETWTMINNK